MGHDEYAPYPTSSDEATAEALAKHFTALACRREGIVSESLRSRDGDFGEQVGYLVDEYAIAFLLHALIEHAPQAADQVARQLWEDWEVGSRIPDQIWEWTVRHRLPHDEIFETAAELRARRGEGR